MIEKIHSINTDLGLAEIGLNQQMLPVFLGILLAAAIAWIFLSGRLYELLKHRFPRVYEALGSPKLVMRKSLRANYRVIMFLLKRAYESTDDLEVIRICRGLRHIFFIYAFCFLGCLLLLFEKVF